MRRAVALMAVTLAVAFSGCGAVGHAVGGAVLHHVLNRATAGHPHAQSILNKGFCIYHGHRILVDVRNHHYFAAGLNGLAAYEACKHGFFRR